MKSDKDIQRELYGKAPTPTTPASSQHPAHDVAMKLYDGNKSTPQRSATRTPLPAGATLEQRAQHLMYGDTPLLYAPIKQAAQKDMTVILDWSEAQQAQHHALFIGLLDEGLDLTVVRRLEGAVRDAQKALKRRGEDPELENKVQLLSEDARERFSPFGKHGEDGPDLLARTKQWVASHPLLQDAMDIEGVGSRPEIVQDLAEFVKKTGYGR